MGTLFYLTIVASHYPSARLTYSNSKCNPSVFVRRGACLRAEGKALQEFLLSMVKKNEILTAMY
jgi:hypothetical protein